MTRFHRLLIIAFVFTIGISFTYAHAPKGIIASGIPLFDNNNIPVNAHGACLLEEHGKYYLFGEWKSDTTNAFQGFSCYSSDDLEHWHFEGLALAQQKDGMLGPNRVGERVKVMKCPTTGEYVMYMHADNLGYKDQYTAYATSRNITGPYTMVGPLLFEGKPLRHWDMGAFQDTNGEGYILIHHGPIYRLAKDYKSVAEKVANVSGSGESPAVFKKDGIYYHLSSNLTSWERNDNYYYTASSISGPWERQGLFCPEGSLTWNSQTSFVFPHVINGDTVPIYMGDRWSFPHQASSATYVWQPLKVKGKNLSIPDFMQFWDASTGESVDILSNTRRDHRGVSGVSRHAVGDALFRSNIPGDKLVYEFIGSKIAITGSTIPKGGYAKISILSTTGDTIHSTLVDFYSLKAAKDIRYISPSFPVNKYMLEVEVSGDHPVWFNKRGDRFGSDDNMVTIEDLYIYDIEIPTPTFANRRFDITQFGAMPHNNSPRQSQY